MYLLYQIYGFLQVLFHFFCSEEVFCKFSFIILHLLIDLLIFLIVIVYKKPEDFSPGFHNLYSVFISIREGCSFSSSSEIPCTSRKIFINSFPVMVSFSIKNAAILSRASLFSLKRRFASS